MARRNRLFIAIEAEVMTGFEAHKLYGIWLSDGTAVDLINTDELEYNTWQIPHRTTELQLRNRKSRACHRHTTKRRPCRGDMVAIAATLPSCPVVTVAIDRLYRCTLLFGGCSTVWREPEGGQTIQGSVCCIPGGHDPGAVA